MPDQERMFYGDFLPVFAPAMQDLCEDFGKAQEHAAKLVIQIAALVKRRFIRTVEHSRSVEQRSGVSPHALVPGWREVNFARAVSRPVKNGTAKYSGPAR